GAYCGDIAICKDDGCRRRVESCLKPDYFDIPEAYLTMKNTWAGGAWDLVKIEVVYPDMGPWAIARRNVARGAAPPNHIAIGITSRGCYTYKVRFKTVWVGRQLKAQSKFVGEMRVNRPPTAKNKGVIQTVFSAP